MRNVPGYKFYRKVGHLNSEYDNIRHTPAGVHELICETIEHAIETFTEPMEVVGEVSHLLDNRHDSGWMFFYLSDPTNSVRCVVPPKTADGIDFSVKEGTRVRVLGKFWLYRKEAKVELLLQSIEPIQTLADRIQSNQLIRQLDEEGLLKASQMKSIRQSPPPSRFAIISPKNSPAPMDIRAAATGTGELTFLVRFMEEYSPEALVAEIVRCNEHADELDAIIIAKGGGEDLSLYDDEQVLRAAINSDLPIICAVGHPADNTLLDFVATESQPSPGLAGKWLKELHRDYRHGRKLERKQIITFAIILLMIVVVIVVLWGMGVFGT